MLNGTNKLKFEDYTYKIESNICTEISKLILGEVECISPFYFGSSPVKFDLSIESDGSLFITRFFTNIKEDQLANISTEFARLINVGRKAIVRMENGKYVEQQVCSINIENVNIPFCFGGSIIAHQIYVDETVMGGKAHGETSTFYFDKGKLNTERSCIYKSTERFISKFLWGPERVQQALDETSAGIVHDSVRMYHVEPSGGLAECEYLIALFVNYLCYNVRQETIDEYLCSAKPLLRLESMVETEPNSCKFSYRVRDLLLAFINRLDISNINKAYPHIDFEKNPNYPEDMLDTLFAKFDGVFERERKAEIIEVLEYFSSKSLKCKNAQKYINEIEDMEIANILGTLIP